MTKNLKYINKPMGLRRQILLSIVILLMLSGLTMVLVTRIFSLEVLKTEFRHKGLSAARTLAAGSVVDVLTQNTSRLNQLVRNEKQLDEDIAYIFIVDSTNHILAHTFDKGFPADLANANKLKANQSDNIQLLDTRLGLIYDIVAPISLGKNILGQARLGILQNNIHRSIMKIDLSLIAATLLFMFMGIFLAGKISSLITEPISRLVQATQSIRKGDFSVKIEINTKDEIGALASAFNEMAMNLSAKIQEINRSNIIEERNRIAFDFHDGFAQNIASIIKRIELCEKLYKTNPQRGSEELEALRNDARVILNMTRQIIFDLKLPEENNFVLLDNLKNYIKNYEKQYGLLVKLNISGPVNDISPEKVKQIFYMVGEAFTNIRKHAQAKNVLLGLEYSDSGELSIHINDDGKGFDIQEVQILKPIYGKWGLISMRQRANSLGGALAIDSRAGQGTKISITIPLKMSSYEI